MHSHCYVEHTQAYQRWSDGSGVYNAGAAYVVPYKDIKLTAQYEEEELPPKLKETVISGSFSL